MVPCTSESAGSVFRNALLIQMPPRQPTRLGPWASSVTAASLPRSRVMFAMPAHPAWLLLVAIDFVAPVWRAGHLHVFFLILSCSSFAKLNSKPARVSNLLGE